MGSATQDLHILFFPFLAPGHIIPTVDMAKLFASRGVKTTILTTHGNAPSIQPSIDRANDSSTLRHPIALYLLPFPAAEVGLSTGRENATAFSFANPDMLFKFMKAIELLHQPFARVLRELVPDAVVTDSFLPWTQDVAAELGVPRLVFHGTNLFYLCAFHSIDHFRVLESVPPGSSQSFVLPGLPHRIEMQRSQLQDLSKIPGFTVFFDRVKNSDERSYGVVANSYCELEPDYAEHYRKVVGRRLWNVGPVSLCNRNEIEEEVMGRGKGLIIRGWAPQILILNHEAVGGFVTHCGWNSCLEGVSAGVPMITWPMFAEQFFNERLIVDVLKVGIGVGVKEHADGCAECRVVTGEEIRRAVGRVMDGGEEAEEMRKRARELAEMGRRAVEEGGSSYVELGELIQELIERRKTTGAE